MINTGINKTVCHLSFGHSPFDDRIYWKELLSLQNAGYRAIHIAVGNETADFITKEGVRIILIKRKRFSRVLILNKILQLIFRNRGTIGQMLKKAIALKADVYHYHDYQINVIVRNLKSLSHKPKIIYDDHEAIHLLLLENVPTGLVPKKLYQFLIDKVSKWEIKKASCSDYIIVTDFYSLSYFEKKLPSIRKKIVFNYSYFIPSQIASQPNKRYHFIYSGSISKTRGILEIIKSISLVKPTFPDIKLLIVGSFENESLKKEVQQTIANLHMENNIDLRSFVPFKEIAVYYEQSLIGLGLFHHTPKYSHFIPIKLFEYMAFGLPVIFSDFGPSADIIKETQCGVLVDTKNLNEIADVMRKLLMDKNYVKELGENGKRAIETKYNWEREKYKLLEIYENL